MIRKLLLFAGISIAAVACQDSSLVEPYKKSSDGERGGITTAAAKPPSGPVTYLTGSAADVTTAAVGGLLLMGGSTDVDAAIQWFLQRAAGGDVVVIRATGADGYNQYMY